MTDSTKKYTNHDENYLQQLARRHELVSKARRHAFELLTEIAFI
jgi:hypothetical protein